MLEKQKEKTTLLLKQKLYLKKMLFYNLNLTITSPNLDSKIECFLRIKLLLILQIGVLLLSEHKQNLVYLIAPKLLWSLRWT